MYFYKAVFTVYQKFTNLIERKILEKLKMGRPLPKFHVSQIYPQLLKIGASTMHQMYVMMVKKHDKMCVMSLECLLHE